MPQCSRRSCCIPYAAIQASMSAGRSFTQDRLTPPGRSGYRLDDPGEVVEYFANLVLAHNQWRTERQRVTNGPKREIALEETQLQRVHAASSDGIGPAGEIDADHQPHGPDVEHVRQTFESHRRTRPRRHELARALEQAFLSIDIERGKAGGAS